MLRFTIGFTALLAACGQNLGERCQLDSDCSPGLACMLRENGDRITGGVCVVASDMGSEPEDLSTSDGVI